jgi:hypothetical protein
LVAKTGKLRHVGDHLRFQRNAPKSWADGSCVVLGENAIDFDMTLKMLDMAAGKATVIVRHVPPEHSPIHVPTAWMGTLVADSVNNRV